LNSYSRVQVRALPHNQSAVQLRLRDVAFDVFEIGPVAASMPATPKPQRRARSAALVLCAAARRVSQRRGYKIARKMKP